MQRRFSSASGNCRPIALSNCRGSRSCHLNCIGPILIGLAVYLLFITVPTQAAEVFRYLLSRNAPNYVIVWSVLWPSLLLSISLALCTELGLKPEGARGRTFGIAFASGAPFVVTGIGISLAVFGHVPELASIARLAVAVCVVAAILMPMAGILILRSLRSVPSVRQYGYQILAVTLVAIFAYSLILPYAGHDRLVSSTRAVGALGLIAIFCASLSVALGFLESLFRGTAVPVITLLIGIAILFWFPDWNDNHEIRTLEKKHQDQRSRQPLDAPTKLRPTIPNVNYMDLASWVSHRSDRNQYPDRYPIFILSAEGGGIYAAYHAASTLARLQDAWPEFGEHLFAISSVSGGSVGAALFILLKREFDHTSVTCSGRQATMEELVDNFLADDHLSPLLFMSLGPDFIQKFWPVPIRSYDSALGLEYSLEESWKRLAKECNFKVQDAFATGFTNFLWSPESHDPALFFNMTEETTGGPVVINTADFSDYLFQPAWEYGLGPELRLSTAAVLSARYPLVTSAAWFRGRKHDQCGKEDKDPVKLYFDDGGIYENTGSELLTKLTLRIKHLSSEASENQAELHIGAIGDVGRVAETQFQLTMEGMRRNIPADADNLEKEIAATEASIRTEKGFPPPPLETAISGRISSSPFGALMKSRQFRDRETIKMLVRLSPLNPWAGSNSQGLSPDNSFLAFPLDAATPDLPLGWLISERTRRFLALRSGNAAKCDYSGSFYFDPNIYPMRKELLDLITSIKEPFLGTLNVWLASCSQRRILNLARPAVVDR